MPGCSHRRAFFLCSAGPRIFEPVLQGVSSKVEDKVGFAEALVVSFADLYAGKLVAALDC